MEQNQNMKVHNLIIVDASGSMESIYDYALSGINETLSNIRHIAEEDRNIEQYVTLLSFSNGEDKLQYIFKEVNIFETRRIECADYALRGMTALYDAIGISVTGLRKEIKNNDKVLVTIITDGYENDSKKWDEQMVKCLIDELSKEGWVFTYIGANHNVECESRKIGVENSLKFSATVEGTIQMFAKERESRKEWNVRMRRGERELQSNYFVPESAPSRTTPQQIDKLESNEVFVFGSDINGLHSGGSALKALKDFGALMGIGEGMQGKSYAIPTTGCSKREMAEAVERFIVYASQHPTLHFLVTAIGCGHAGYEPREMAALFIEALPLDNVSLPAVFWRYLY